MIVGILKEIKTAENRVCMTPAGAEMMVQHGHNVLVEKGAGNGSGFSDNEYEKCGARIFTTAEAIYAQCEMVMHVKEPLPAEYKMIRKGQIIFTYLHLAANRMLTETLMKSESICIAYETIQKENGSLPLLTPMSEVAGRMAVQQGAKYLEMPQGGSGVLLGGVTGVEPGTVLIIGGGIVGINAAKMACGLGAKVYVLDTNTDRLRYLSDVMPANCIPLMSGRASVRDLIKSADLVIGAVLVPGAKAPVLITKNMLKTMKRGSVIVDVDIDQGGCVETSRATTHKDPVYEVEGIIHYCVANMPGAVPKTSTMALTNATLPYALQIADKGWEKAMKENREILHGSNILNGKLTYQGVADAFGMKFSAPDEFIH